LEKFTTLDKNEMIEKIFAAADPARVNDYVLSIVPNKGIIIDYMYMYHY